MRPRWAFGCALLGALLSACSDDSEREPPVFQALSPSLLTFEGQWGGVIVEVDRRARFSVIDDGGHPRGTAVAEQAGRFEIPFDPTGLPASGSDLRVVGTSDSGGRAVASVHVRHGALGLPVFEDDLYDATLLTDFRVLVAGARGLFLQAAEGSSQFDGPLDAIGATRRVVAAGPDGDSFAAGDDDVVLHYESDGTLCDSIRLLATQVEGGDAHPTHIEDMATQFGAGSIEVTAAHDLGFSGFDFTGRPCASDGCQDLEECSIDPTSGFSTGTCLTSTAAPDFRATAIAMDADRAYTGGYTFNVRSLSAGTNVCVDLQMPADASGAIEDIAVSESSVWVALDRGISRVERGFSVGSGVARPDVERFGEGRAVADGLERLPDADIQTLAAVAPGSPSDGVWFGTPSGFGLIVRTDAGAEAAWVSGLSLPGRSVRAILAPPSEAGGLLWVATDGGLARLLLPAGF